MRYQAELDYLMQVLHKMNLQALILTPDNLSRQRPDLGLRKFLGQENLYEQALQTIPETLHDNAIFHFTDEFLCNYIFLRLPERTNHHLVIGPYTAVAVPRERLLEMAERHGISARQFSQFEMCFAGIPVLMDDNALFAMVSAFGETLWGKGNAFQFVDFALNLPVLPPNGAPTAPGENAVDPEELALQMQTMEKRYAYENELMEYVSQGLTSRAEHMIRQFSGAALMPRAADPIRSAKNYCIICNTLMRKAAEKGGVHPLQLDLYSATLGRKAELITDPDEATETMREMVRTYCRLVRKYAIGHFPPLVQRTLTYIDGNLAGDLSLKNLAAIHNVSGSYLSALFCREYGKTLTECILEKRMDMASGLLLSTHLQVQTVAQHCGFSDVNYFSKVFKKTFGVTPRQFREYRTMPIGLSLHKNHDEGNV